MIKEQCVCDLCKTVYDDSTRDDLAISSCDVCFNEFCPECPESAQSCEDCENYFCSDCGDIKSGVCQECIDEEERNS